MDLRSLSEGVQCSFYSQSFSEKGGKMMMAGPERSVEPSSEGECNGLASATLRLAEGPGAVGGSHWLLVFGCLRSLVTSCPPKLL